jgi:hypothetical protein
MLNPDKQPVADLRALPKTTIGAVHCVSTSGGLELGPNQLPQDGSQ